MEGRDETKKRVSLGALRTEELVFLSSVAMRPGRASGEHRGDLRGTAKC